MGDRLNTVAIYACNQESALHVQGGGLAKIGRSYLAKRGRIGLLRMRQYHRWVRLKARR